MEQNKFYQIINITEREYTLVGCDDSVITRPIQDIDKSASAFTIQDAKDGDVLASKDGDEILIFRNLDSNTSFSSYYNIKGEGEIGWSNRSFIPATKEQRDLLFQKMKEAGYEWDAEKKELKKIVAPIFHIGDRVRYKGHSCDGVITEITNTDYICGDAKLPISTQDKLELVEQKSTAWSEEDENIINRLLAICVGAKRYRQFAGCSQDDVTKYQTWLKSLKDRYTWKPSDEQMDVIAQSVAVLKVNGYGELGDRLGDISEQLNKLREK